MTFPGSGPESDLWRWALRFTLAKGYTLDPYHAIRVTGLPFGTAERVVKRAAADARRAVQLFGALRGYGYRGRTTRMIKARMLDDVVCFPVL